MAEFDPHGQPFNIKFNRARRAERDLCEVLGLARGLLADGVVTADEASRAVIQLHGQLATTSSL
jgi:hypothetical protein